MEEIGFKTTLADSCVFTQMIENQYIYLSLYVNDFFCIKTKTNCQSTKVVLKKQLKLKSTKDIVYLGIKISHKPDGTL
jgi:hypothetical protein